MQDAVGPIGRVPAGDGRGLSPGDTTPGRVAPGRVFAGTSGFAYPAWAPRFYPAGPVAATASSATTPRGSAACELNNTFYARPKPDRIDGWLAAAPDGFRFVVKAQRGASFRALFGRSGRRHRLADGAAAGVRRALGGVLFRVDRADRPR